METIATRLKRLREARGLSQGELARRVGFKSQSGIGNIESGTRGYGAKIIDIARELGTTPEYLRIEGAETGDRPFDANVTGVEPGKRAYPVISAIQAGKVREIADPYAPGDGFDVEYGDDNWSKWTFALQIEGESMLPEFRPGDRVLVDPSLSPRPGDFVVARNHKEEATFKKYRVRGQDERGNAIFDLVPLNEDFETLRSDEHGLRVIGVMVEHRKRYRRPA